MRSIAVLSFSIFGCGALSEPGSAGEPLLVLKQRITKIEDTVDFTSLRAAFFWSQNLLPPGVEPGVVLDDEGWLVGFVSEDVPVNPGLSLRFSLNLYDLPPREYLLPDLPFAVGTMVIYDDRNQNERLDLLSANAPVAIDQILGPEESYRVIFIDHGMYQSSVDFLETPGFHVLRNEPTPPLDPEFFFGMPIAEGEELPVTLKLDPEKQSWMCSSKVATERQETFFEDAELADVPADARIDCSSDRRMFVFHHLSRTQASICAPMLIERIDGTVALAPGEQIPAEWPCL